VSQRTAIKRHPERAVPDETQEILAKGLVAHVGFSHGEQPVVIPLVYQYDPATPNKLYLETTGNRRAHMRCCNYNSGSGLFSLRAVPLDELRERNLLRQSPCHKGPSRENAYIRAADQPLPSWPHGGRGLRCADPPGANVNRARGSPDRRDERKGEERWPQRPARR
jgi:Pyridoxamine 5'-phosphate oxidase